MTVRGPLILALGCAITAAAYAESRQHGMVAWNLVSRHTVLHTLPGQLSPLAHD